MTTMDNKDIATRTGGVINIQAGNGSRRYPQNPQNANNNNVNVINALENYSTKQALA